MPAGPTKSVHGSFSIPSLDGIRAIAVLVVVYGHSQTGIAGPYWPGFVGVTIFFFLSGYLITTLLRREFEQRGTISLRNFYLRRTLRIIPPAWLAVGVAVAIGAVGWVESDTTVWGVLATLFSYANYYIVINGREGLPPDTSQFWSLGVEEHFYLLIPVILLVLWRTKAKRRTIGWTLAALALIAPVWRVALGLMGASFDRLYISSDTRFDSLLLGTALALLANPMLGDRIPEPVRRRLPLFAGAATIAFVACAFVPSLSFRLSIADTIECLCLVPVFWYVTTRPASVVGRVLNSDLMTRIGILSFAVYLFHRMGFSLGENLSDVPALADLIGFAMTVVVAELTYRLVERPIAKLRRRLEAGSRQRERDVAMRRS